MIRQVLQDRENRRSASAETRARSHPSPRLVARVARMDDVTRDPSSKLEPGLRRSVIRGEILILVDFRRRLTAKTRRFLDV